MKKVIIAGAGVSGLAFAYECLLRGFHVLIMESTSEIGGICRTISHHGCKLDIGSHVLYAKDSQVEQKIREIVGSEKWIKIRRYGKLYLKGRYVDWPLRYSSNGGVAGT